MAKVSIVFAGMCGIQVTGSNGTVYMFSEDGEHKPALVIPTNKFVDPNPALTTWKPDAIGYVKDSSGGFAQVGIWSLRGVTVSVKDGAPASITWADRDHAIDFKKEHVSAATLSVKDVQGKDPYLSVFQFTGGVLSAADRSDATITRSISGDEDVDNLTSKVELAIQVDEIVNQTAGKRIKLSGDGACTVSNLAPVPADEGGTHVKFYYELLSGVKDDDDKLTNVKDQDTTTYDCIRPAALP